MFDDLNSDINGAVRMSREMFQEILDGKSIRELAREHFKEDTILFNVDEKLEENYIRAFATVLLLLFMSYPLGLSPTLLYHKAKDSPATTSNDEDFDKVTKTYIVSRYFN